MEVILKMKVERSLLRERQWQEYWYSKQRKHREQARVRAVGRCPILKFQAFKAFVCWSINPVPVGLIIMGRFSSSNIPELLTTMAQVGVLVDWRVPMSVYSSM